jgi:hypothetical protein
MALHVVASLGPDMRDLLIGLDVFRRGRGSKAARQSAHSPHDGSAAFSDRKIADEGFVDLDLVEVETAQIAQAGITRSKIVQRYPDAELSETSQKRAARFAALEKDRFCSNSSRLGDGPEAARAASTAGNNRPLLNCAGDTFTVTVM